ncbi:MAG: hypothetical protein FJX62_19275 [Alphaproteobacteria bacterium]|nr:hypothetical protein [Alphaproteobacteria bacterium]
MVLARLKFRPSGIGPLCGDCVVPMAGGHVGKIQVLPIDHVTLEAFTAAAEHGRARPQIAF